MSDDIGRRTARLEEIQRQLDASPAVLAQQAVAEARAADSIVDSVVFARGETIKAEPIDWIWSQWLAAGKLHLIAGAPGTGKTTLALALATTITRGGTWPDGTRAMRGSVVMWSGEDDVADTLLPRLLTAGADVSRIYFVRAVDTREGRMPFDPARDVTLLAAQMTKVPDVRMLIVDPIVTAVQGDSHKNAEVRRGLQPLVDLAHARGCALVGITHLSKGTAGRDPVERVTGSLAFGALARVVLLAARQEAEDGKPAQRLLLRAKSNIGPDSGGFTYDLRQVEVPGHAGLIASAVFWGGTVDGSARELLADAEQRDDDRTSGSDAADFLHELLRDGPRPAKEVFAEAKSAGYSTDQMHRAKRKLSIRPRKTGMGGGWTWSLPSTEGGAEDGEDCTSRKGTTFATFGGQAPSSGEELCPPRRSSCSPNCAMPACTSSPRMAGT